MARTCRRCELADPFGEDQVDFPVMKLMTNMRATVAPIVLDVPWYPDASPPADTGRVRKVAISRYALGVPE